MMHHGRRTLTFRQPSLKPRSLFIRSKVLFILILSTISAWCYFNIFKIAPTIHNGKGKIRMKRTSKLVRTLLHAATSPPPQFNASELFSLVNENNDTPDFISTYAKWHASHRLCLDTGKCDVNSSTGMLIWRCPRSGRDSPWCAGVGDRLRGIQFAFALAIITRRLFFIDWPASPISISDAIAPSLIDWRLPSLLEHNRSTLSTWPELQWFDCYGRPPSTLCSEGRTMPHDHHLPPPSPYANKEPDFNLSRGDVVTRLQKYHNLVITTRQRAVSLMRIASFLNYTPSSMDENDIEFDPLQRTLLRALFRPSHAVNKILDALLPGPLEVALHVRTGLDLGEAETSRFVKQNKDNVNTTAYNVLRNTSSLTNGVVFVATDSQLFKRSCLRARAANDDEFKFRLILSDVPSIHFGKSGAAAGHDLDFNEKYIAFLNVFVEFFAIARARIVLSNGSGFSRMGYLVGKGNTWKDLSI